MIYPIRTILAAVGELEAPYDVLGPALDLAERTGATLHLVHAFDLPELTWDIYARIGYPDSLSLHEHADRLRKQLQERVGALSTYERVQCHAVSGSPPAAVRTLCRREQPDLIVIGATRHGRIGQALLGTTAQRVLRAARVPVLVLRGRLPTRLQRVLLTTDLSPFSAGIHELGLDVVESIFGNDAEVRSLLVVPFGTELPPPLRSDRLQAAAQNEVDAFVRARRERERPCSGVVRLGDPATGIIAECRSWEPDLLVLGTHGRHGPERWVLGSVAEAALRAAMVSVLVIPAALQEERTLPVPQVHPRQESGTAAPPPRA